MAPEWGPDLGFLPDTPHIREDVPPYPHYMVDIAGMI